MGVAGETSSWSKVPASRSRAMARHHQPQHEAQHADEVGQEEPLELEIGVEPAALPDVQAAAARQRGLPPQRCLRGHLGQHDLHIVGRYLGRVGTPAVQ